MPAIVDLRQIEVGVIDLQRSLGNFIAQIMASAQHFVDVIDDGLNDVVRSVFGLAEHRQWYDHRHGWNSAPRFGNR